MRPRTWGESFSSRTLLSLPRPRALTLKRWRPLTPRRPLTRRTRTVPALAAASFFLAITQHLFDRLATLGGDALGRGYGLQALDGGADQVDRVTRTHGLGQDVLHADHFEHGAHGTDGDHAGTLGSALHVDAGSAVVGLDGVPQGAVVQFDAHHLAARALHGLGDGDRHFTGLAITEADAALAIAHYRERGETHLATALDRLGHAGDGDELFQHPVRIFTIVRRHLRFLYARDVLPGTFVYGLVAAWSCMELKVRGQQPSRAL